MFQDAIAEFWEWWATIRDTVEREIAEGGISDDTIDGIEERVWRIHPDLNWQITGGIEAPHSLNLVSGGTRLLRLVAELWRRMGPGDDDRWEHHPSRLPFGLAPFEIGGFEVDPSLARFTAAEDPLYERLDLTIAHPAFINLDDEEAAEAAMHILDATLGEDAVERWLGILETTTDLPGGEPIFTARSTFERFGDEASGEGWERVDDQYDGVVMAQVNRAVKWIDHIDKPLYAEMTIRALTTDQDGLPVPLEQKRLESVVADLLTRLGGDGVLLGTALGDGEQTVHLYVGTSDRVEAAISEWREANDNREIEVDLVPDEQWQNAEQWD